MDIENLTRQKIIKNQEKKLNQTLTNRILEFKNIPDKDANKLANAVITEVKNSLKINNTTDNFLKEILTYHKSNITMGEIGVGSRGKGDFYVHNKLAEIINTTSTKSFIDPTAQDDGGVVKTKIHNENTYITTAIDGIHSRLSEYPFLGGFHVARASLRDIYVMGSKPIALISDLHLADDGDVNKLFDFTAGVSCISELTKIPIVAGSTLRIGGDMVLGDRLVSAIGAIGISNTSPTARKKAQKNDVIILTYGSGGGTITTTAIYNAIFDVIKETLNIDFIKTANTILNSDILPNVHAMTDITNGGIRGDLHEISKSTNIGMTVDKEKIENLINPKVLEMLLKLNIDPLGVSIDSLLIILPENYASDLINLLNNIGVQSGIIGYMDDTKEPKIIIDNKTEPLSPLFRESSYTPIKKVIGEKTPENFESMKEKIDKSAKKSIQKKDNVLNHINNTQ